MSTAAAPIEIAQVVLTVHDLSAMTAFYETALGLSRLGEEAMVARLGAGDRALLELRQDQAARRAGPREAGLFHTAFLLPDRVALGRWLQHAIATELTLQGASDHLVSEAIYLSDPEGNGIEVYADRPRATWHDADGAIRLANDPLDLPGLLQAADTAWTAAPSGTVIGHVHLQVGALAEAEAFYGTTLGLPVIARYPGAAFFGAGGYHHHIATNVWNSRGATPRSFPATGLTELVLAVAPAERQAIVARGGADRMVDPWATPLTLTDKSA